MGFSLSYFGKRNNRVSRKSKNRDVIGEFRKQQQVKKAKKKEKKKSAVCQQAPARKFHLEPLEPRLLLSADLAFTDASSLTSHLNDLDNLNDVYELVNSSNIVVDTTFSDVVGDSDDIVLSPVVTGNSTKNSSSPQYLRIDSASLAASDPVEALTDESLVPILDQALLQWSSADLADGVGDRLAQIDVRIADLAGDILGETRDNTIYLDSTAAGYGWFVDSTPADNSEFTEVQSANQLKAESDSQALGRIDLLTVVSHEIGHVLGFDHTDASDETDVMSNVLDTGVRLLSDGDFDIASDPEQAGAEQLLANGATLNAVIDALLASNFDYTIDPNPAGTFEFTTLDEDVPDIITVGQTAFGGVDLQLENVTLEFSLLQYDFTDMEWDGLVGLEAELGILYPDLLDIVIIDDAFDAPRRIESASAVTENSGIYTVTFTLYGDHTDIKNGDEIAVLNSNASAFDDADLEDDVKQIMVTDVTLNGSGSTTITVEYNFNPESDGSWNGGSVIALADPDDDDDALLNAVAGTLNLSLDSGEVDFLVFDNLEAADIGWPGWLDIKITNLEFEFVNFRADDSQSTLRLDAAFLGFDTGSEVVNELISSTLSVEGTVSGIEFDMDRLAEATLELGVVTIPRNPIVDISGISGEVSGDLFGVGSLSAGFILKQISLDSFGNITTLDAATVETVIYGAARGAVGFGGIEVPVSGSPGETTTEGGFAFGLNFAISELGPLQFFVFADVPIILEPVSGLAISSMRGGIRFNSSIEDLQVRDPFGATAGSATLANATQYKFTLTVPDHNLKVGDEFRVTGAGNSNYNTGTEHFVVTEVDGDEISYLVVGIAFYTLTSIRLLEIILNSLI